MKISRNPDRRRFLRTAAGVAAIPAASCTRAGRRWRFLTDEQADTIGAICDQIIPPDQDPGAVSAGVVHFIDRQLKGHYAYLQDAYIKGVVEIEQAAQEKFGKRFSALASEQQLDLLREREKTAFFRMIADHAMQGFYGDPRHGGNRDFASWKMMGIPNPPVRGRQQHDLTKS
ncbi:MAG: gluconate 2-dehydrogenase subunit 3 family protein [Bryobacteraceae bacterium]|nr:gluconate 2-dehydrogenase subunit 3 family protein [Bryobacteraceae bacterium]